MAIDLHTHTEASFDSSCSMDERVRLATEADITAIACTDHAAVHPDLDRPTQMIDGVEVITGIELFTTGACGRMDILGLMIDPETLRDRFDSEEDRVSYEQAIDLIHQAGGIAVLAHPGRYDIDLADAVEQLVDAGIDGIETAYPYQFVSDPMPYTPHGEIESIARSHDLIETGGSDCHGTRRQHIGSIRLDESILRTIRKKARNG